MIYIEPRPSPIAARKGWAKGPIFGAGDWFWAEIPVDLRKYQGAVNISRSLPLFLWPKGGCSQGTVARNHTQRSGCLDSGLAKSVG